MVVCVLQINFHLAHDVTESDGARSALASEAVNQDATLGFSALIDELPGAFEVVLNILRRGVQQRQLMILYQVREILFDRTRSRQDMSDASSF